MFKQSKRILTLFLCFTMLISTISIIGTGSAYAFSDTSGHWAETVINSWSNRGVISGDGDGNFRPNDSITRAEFAKIIATANKYTEQKALDFSDVSTDDWYYDALSKSVTAGIINGYTDGTFRPDNKISREEAAAIIARAYDLGNDLTDISFTDQNQIADWSLNYIKILYNQNIIAGYPDGSFMPQAPITRAETVQMLDRVNTVTNKDAPEGTLIQTPITGPQFGLSSGNFGGSGGSLSSSRPTTTPNKNFNVTFILNDGSNGAYEMQVVEYGSKVTKPSDPSRDLYKFTGWYTEAETINKYNFSSKVTADIVLYAGWGNPDNTNGLYSAMSGEETIYSVTGMELQNDIAIVTINTNNSCALVLEFYDEATNELSATTAIQTPSYCEMVPISIPVNLNELPEHFIVFCKLIDSNGSELCSSYKFIERTVAYEEFDRQTTENFDESKVINFDNDKTNNFGVLSDDVIKFSSSDVLNTLIAIDGEGTDIVTYTFKNLDEQMQALEIGDKIYIEGSECLFQIDDIILNNDGSVSYASIENAEDPTELADYYDVLKVDTEVGIENAKSKENIEINSEENVDVSLCAEVIDITDSWTSSLGTSLSYEFNDNFKITGSLKGTGGVSVKLLYDAHLFRDDYFCASITSTLEVELGIEVETSINNNDKIEKKFEAAKVSIDTPVPGLTVFVQPSIPTEWEITGNGNFTFKYKTENGFTYDTDSGRQTVDKKSHSLEFKLEGKAELKFGPKVEFGVQYGIPHTSKDDVLKAAINGQFGIKITAHATVGGEWTDAESQHACNLCVSGEAKWFITVDAKLSVNLTKKLKYDVFDVNLINFEGWINAASITPGKFYISLINSNDSVLHGNIKFGFGSCPNQTYRTKIIVKNEDGSTADGINVTINRSNGTNIKSADSPLTEYLYNGTYSASANIDGTLVKKSISVSGGPQEIELSKSSSDGSFSGKVCDAETNAELPDATILISQGSAIVASEKSKTDGSYEVNLADGTYCIETTKDGYIPFKEYASISNGAVNYLSVTKLIRGDKNAHGGFSGQITDAVTGEVIPDVKLKLREGWNNTSYEHVLKTLTTDNNGYFVYNLTNILGITLGLPVGNYTLEASKDGYSSMNFNIVVLPNIVKDNQDASMSSSISEGKYRIVLRWDENPRDLDSHLVGPTSNNSTFHTWYSNKTYSESRNIVADLDIDDTTSYGPETTTIHKLENGKYYFYVHHYAGAGSISTSEAQVTIYTGNQAIATYNAPTNQNGLYWNVFVIDTIQDKIILVNTITDAPIVSAASSDLYNDTPDDSIISLIDKDIINSPKK